MKNINWRLMVEGLKDGALNMATDEALLVACSQGTPSPTLRLYGWNSPTLSIGYSQDLDHDVDLASCQRLGIPIVRRPTGGRALLHQMELTYCLVAPIPHPQFPSGLRKTYEVVSEAVLRALSLLGVTGAKLAGAAGRRENSSGLRSPLCYAANNHCEILVGNRKLVGSAQRRLSGAFLQHGSIPIQGDRNLENSLFSFSSEEVRQVNLNWLKQRTVTLSEIFQENIPFKGAASAFVEGFQEVFPGDWSSGELSPAEENLRNDLLKNVDPQHLPAKPLDLS